MKQLPYLLNISGDVAERLVEEAAVQLGQGAAGADHCGGFGRAQRDGGASAGGGLGGLTQVMPHTTSYHCRICLEIYNQGFCHKGKCTQDSSGPRRFASQNNDKSFDACVNGFIQTLGVYSEVGQLYQLLISSANSGSPASQARQSAATLLHHYRHGVSLFAI